MTGSSARSMIVLTWPMAASLLLMSLLASAAQGAHQLEEPPMAEEVPVPEALAPKVPEFRSPLETFRAYTEAEPIPWQAANDRVGKIGGWRVYAREAFEAEESPEQGEQSGESP